MLAKALRINPQQRYSSAEAFAADVQRHLDGDPVLAQAPSRRYIAVKFMRRHRLPLLTAASVAASVFLGLGAALWQAREAARQAQLAQDHLARTEAALDFTSMVLTDGLRTGEALTLEDVVRRSETLIETGVSADPVERVVAADAVASWFSSYGAYDRAERLLTRTLDAMPRDFDAAKLAILRCKRATARANLGQSRAALEEIDTAIAALKEDPGAASQCLQRRSYVTRSLNDAAGTLRDIQEAIERFNALGGKSSVRRALLTADLAYALSLNGKTAQAHQEFESAAALFAMAGRAESGPAVAMYNNWAVALLSAGDPRAALRQVERAKQISRRRSPTGDLPIYVQYNLAQALRALGRSEEALSAYEHGARIARTQRDRNLEARSLIGQALALRELGRIDEAQQHVDQARAQVRSVSLPADNPTALHLDIAQALIWQSQGKLREADSALEGVQRDFAKPGLSIGTHASLSISRAEIAIAEGRLAQAAALADQAQVIALDMQGNLAHSSLTGQAWLVIAQVHHARGDAAAARDAARRACEHLDATIESDHPARVAADRIANGGGGTAALPTPPT